MLSEIVQDSESMMYALPLFNELSDAIYVVKSVFAVIDSAMTLPGGPLHENKCADHFGGGRFSINCGIDVIC
jgi:hypothetical protein